MKSLIALVGMKHRGQEAFVASLPQGEPLVLVRETTNAYDPNAVQVWARGTHVGYLKAQQVKPVALMMDKMIAEKKLDARSMTLPALLAIDGGRWPMVEVEE